MKSNSLYSAMSCQKSSPLVQVRWGIVVTPEQIELRPNHLVYADAVSIQRRGVRVAGVELCQPRPGCRTVGHGVCIQERLHSSWSSQPRRSVWDDTLLREWLAQAQPFIRKEKECPVFEDSTTEDATEIVLVLRGFWEMVEIGEPVVSIQRAIPEIFEQRTVISIRAEAGHD